MQARHIVISPHFDDAALSLGGTVARLREAGVLVVTICTAVPEGVSLSPLARGFVASCGHTDAKSLFAARRAEESRALALLGASGRTLDEPDAIFRGYGTAAELFGPPRQGDPLLARLARLRLPREATVYLPLGVGGHVDHRIASQLSHQRVVFYEDLPYALTPHALLRRLAEAGRGLTPERVDIGATLSQKLRAVEAYRSQLDLLFGGALEMRAALTRYARELAGGSGYAERLWVPRT